MSLSAVLDSIGIAYQFLFLFPFYVLPSTEDTIDEATDEACSYAVVSSPRIDPHSAVHDRRGHLELGLHLCGIA